MNQTEIQSQSQIIIAFKLPKSLTIRTLMAGDRSITLKTRKVQPSAAIKDSENADKLIKKRVFPENAEKIDKRKSCLS